MTTNQPDIAHDPIAAHLESEDRYWRAEGRDEHVTAKSGWLERWELSEGPR